MINAINISILRNAEYIQFMKNFAQLVKDNDPSALNVSTQHTAIEDKITELENLFKQDRSNPITQELLDLDKRRDNAIIGITALLRALEYHFKPTQRQAAKTLLQNLSVYGSGIARQNYQAQTATLNNLIEDWENKATLSTAINELSIADWKDELKDANTKFDSKYLERTVEYGAENPERLKDLRTATNEVYAELKNHLNAHYTINNTAVYTKTMNELNALIQQYNALIQNKNAGEQDS